MASSSAAPPLHDLPSMPFECGESVIYKFKLKQAFEKYDTLYVDEEQHVSHPAHPAHKSHFRGHGSVKKVLKWYENLPHIVKDMIIETGFGTLIQALKATYCDRYLYRVLSYYWWDSTHTFHFPRLGEMTLTPMDFSAISGLAVEGKRLDIDLTLCNERERLKELVGDHWHLFHGQRQVKWTKIMSAYKDYDTSTEVRRGHLLRVFLLILIGTTVFCGTSTSFVYTYYLSSLADIMSIKKYNWGGAALAVLYMYMDGLSRGQQGSGGFWQVWQVWACEYIHDIGYVQQLNSMESFPRAKNWSASAKGRMLRSLAAYKRLLDDVVHEGIVWSPWGDADTWPEYVKKSLVANRQRLLLESPVGRAWYLAERVSQQSSGEGITLVPLRPPVTMYDPRLNGVDLLHGLQGSALDHHVDPSHGHHYKSWWNIQPKPAHYGGSCSTGADDIEVGTSMEQISSCATRADIVLPSPWVSLPDVETGETQLVRIPNVPLEAVECMPLPEGTTHVPRTTVEKLLVMVTGLKKIASDTLIQAHIKYRDLKTRMTSQVAIARPQHADNGVVNGGAEDEDGSSEEQLVEKVQGKRSRTKRKCPAKRTRR